MARLLWTLVLTGRMVDYVPLSGPGLSIRAFDKAVCTINSSLLLPNKYIILAKTQVASEHQEALY